MTIVDELKKLIISRGGQTAGIQTIAQACKALNAIEARIDNPLKALTVDTTIEAATDLLGKVVANLQTGVVFNAERGEVTGTSKYVSGYTGFSGLESEQSGNYVALHAYVPDATGVTLKVLGKDGTEKALDEDGILIRRIADGRPIVITAYKDGCTPVSRTFDLSKLTLEPKPAS